MTTRQQLKLFPKGKKFENHNFYDWFCRDSSLEKKSENLFKKLNSISKSSKFDLDKTYSYFKNNCPIKGTTYDDFRICDLESGNTIYTVSYRKGIYEVFGKENNFNCSLVEGKWIDIKNFFLN